MACCTLQSWAILVFAGYLETHAHSPLDPTVWTTRTCPYESNMEQRLAQFSQIVYHVSNSDEIQFGLTRSEFNDQFSQNIFNPNYAFVSLPNSIYDSQTWFTYQAYVSGLLDMNGHVSWYRIEGILHGITPSEDEQISSEIYNYGKLQNVSFYDYLQQLSYGIKIVPGVSYYLCDDEVAWGFNTATVFIKEKTNDTSVCRTRRYMGSAEIYTTFRRVQNEFGNDEWLMEEIGIFWDIYSEQDEVKCPDNEDESEPIIGSPDTDDWQISASFSSEEFDE